jgi:hypothetical protein
MTVSFLTTGLAYLATDRVWSCRSGRGADLLDQAKLFDDRFGRLFLYKNRNSFHCNVYTRFVDVVKRPIDSYIVSFNHAHLCVVLLGKVNAYGTSCVLNANFHDTFM